MAQTTPLKANQEIYRGIKNVLERSRLRVWQATNTEMVVCYWEMLLNYPKSYPLNFARCDEPTVLPVGQPKFVKKHPSHGL